MPFTETKKGGKTQKHFMWTKSDMKLLLNQWETETTETLAEKIGCAPQSIGYMVHVLRKEGFRIPKKHRGGYIMNLVRELKQELN